MEYQLLRGLRGITFYLFYTVHILRLLIGNETNKIDPKYLNDWWLYNMRSLKTCPYWSNYQNIWSLCFIICLHSKHGHSCAMSSQHFLVGWHFRKCVTDRNFLAKKIRLSSHVYNFILEWVTLYLPLISSHLSW